MNERTQRILAGAVCIVLGASICLIATEILPYDPDKIHAPKWVILLCGAVFIAGGIAAIFRSNPLFVAVLGNAIVVSFAAIAAWIAIAGPAEQFSGGLPFVSHELDINIARIAFGLGSLLCALALIPGLRQLVKLASQSTTRSRQKSDPPARKFVDG